MDLKYIYGLKYTYIVYKNICLKIYVLCKIKMCCVKKYVLCKNYLCSKNIFVVYKNICWVKLALWDTSYFLNSRVTVSLTMLIRLSHESRGVGSFSTENESRSLCTAAARQS